MIHTLVMNRHVPRMICRYYLRISETYHVKNCLILEGNEMELVDFFVLKDGLPIFSKSESRASKMEFSHRENQLTMVSGFLSAISSFASNLGSFGTMRELSMSDNIKITFQKEQLRNNDLLYVLITRNSESYEINNRLLRKISSHFAGRFRNELLAPWNGDVERFFMFESELMQDYNEFLDDMRVREHILYLKQREILTKQLYLHGKTILGDQMENIQTQNQLREQSRPQSGMANLEAQISNITPIRKIDDRRVIESVSFSKITLQVFDAIDNQKTISEIAREVGISIQETFNVCKAFIKPGFIVLTQ